MVQDLMWNYGENGHVVALNVYVKTSWKYFIIIIIIIIVIKEIEFESWIGFIWFMTISIDMLLYSKAGLSKS